MKKQMTDDELDRYQEEFGSPSRPLPPRSLLHKSSIAVRTQVFDEESGDWKEVIRMSRRKFDNPAAQGVFLREYAKWGRMGDAAAAAGVSTQTVRKAMEDDEDFAEAVLIAEESYRDRLIGHHQNLVFNGTEKESYDRNGNLVGRETVYPIRLIELELKKHDKGYRDKQEVDITHKGGVLVAPAQMNSIDDWESRFANMKTVSPPEEDDDE